MRVRLSIGITVGIMMIANFLAVAPAGQRSAQAAAEPHLVTLSAHRITGRIVTAPADDRGPTTLTIQVPKMGVLTVTVGARTLIHRHYGSLTQLDEVNVGDLLLVIGSFSSSTTFAATSITDWSIMKLSDRFYGKIISIKGMTITARKLTDPQDNLNMIPTGTVVTLSLSPKTSVLVPAPTPAHGVDSGTMASLVANQIITAHGIYDRAHHTYTVVAIVRVIR